MAAGMTRVAMATPTVSTWHHPPTPASHMLLAFRRAKCAAVEDATVLFSFRTNIYDKWTCPHMLAINED